VPSLSSVAGPYIPLVRGLRGLISGPARSYAAQLCRWRRPIDCSIDHRRPLHPPRSPLGRRGRLLQAAGSAGASLALHFGLSGYLRWSSARAAVNALHYADAVVAVALAASSVPTWPCRTRSGWRCAVRPLIRAASAVVRDVERRRCRRGPRVRRLPLPHGAGRGGLAGLCSVWGVLAAGSGAAGIPCAPTPNQLSIKRYVGGAASGERLCTLALTLRRRQISIRGASFRMASAWRGDAPPWLSPGALLSAGADFSQTEPINQDVE